MLNNDFSLAGAKSDILKLVLCYMIVLLHTVELDYTFPILRCAVPLFFMLSSYFLFSKMCRCQTPNEKKHLLYGYIKRNLQLYSFWTLLFIPFIVQFRGWLNEGGVLLILRDVLFAGTFPASWYIIASVYGTIFIYYASRYLPHIFYYLFVFYVIRFVFFPLIMEHFLNVVMFMRLIVVVFLILIIVSWFHSYGFYWGNIWQSIKLQ